jgi:glycine receptor
MLSHNGADYVLVNDEAVRKEIWWEKSREYEISASRKPDLYFSNARSAQFHHVTMPNFNMFIAPNGTVASSSRLIISFLCSSPLMVS